MRAIRYKHLWAWDSMMRSSPYWKDENQRIAAAERAPLDAVYWKRDSGDTGPRHWTTFREVEAERTKAVIGELFASMDWGSPDVH